MNFNKILEKYRKIAFSERDKGTRFERLMVAYLQTDPKYSTLFKKVVLWRDFVGKNDLGGQDTGIDLVAITKNGDYWAIQCKCVDGETSIDKASVDSFLATSSREFINDELQKVRFIHRLWISTTNNWSANATEALRNQVPPVTRINLHDLIESPVDWEKLEKGVHGEESRKPKKTIKPHQVEAVEKANYYYKDNERGKLIMACGTGKTFVSLKIAEKETKGKGFILFLVPSIALLGQALREWYSEALETINAVCICSDPEVSKKGAKNEDLDSISIIDLALPASTDVKAIMRQFGQFENINTKGLTVVFSTYQSIEVIAKAQKELIKKNSKYKEFDLIICDEAHRTTGVALTAEDSSDFIKVHNNEFLKSKKRMYMTATPRIYSDDSKSKAAREEAILCSMDDKKIYGEEFYRIGFGESVEKDLLTDYKVLILTLSDKDIPPSIQKMIADKNTEINSDDATKLVGCINALSKQVLGDEGILKATDPDPMKRAIAFCQTIAISKKITNTFNDATGAYLTAIPSEKRDELVSIQSKHIDGTMSAPKRDELMDWLKIDGEGKECRILTNVRCLSEGVDVPALDAVLFLSARNSQIDVVQSVGRVMRKAPNKKYGYIVIPVVVPSEIDPNKALDDNEKYKVVWMVLNALRAHDDRFNAIVNKIDLNKKKPPQILVGGTVYSFHDGEAEIKEKGEKYGEINEQLVLQFEQLQSVVFAKMVQKVGDRGYWEQWAKNVAEIAQRHKERITKIVRQEGKHRKTFERFLIGLQKNINPSITEQEAIDMLSQHIITKPVFEALFEGYSFVKNNAISLSMQKMLDLLEEQSLEKDTETLNKFYESVKMRASGIDNAEGRQKIIIELYDKFFKSAFPLMVEKLGIVYTPVEVVDFIIHSVNDVLIREFDRELGDENIHLLDPFTGTGTFITRLIQSGLISKRNLKRKYHEELHANEIVLLAYYIAAINIENAFHDAFESEGYESFDGICLTDTFQLGESEEGDKLISEMFTQNSDRVLKQKKAPLRIIIGNPPYSIGQKSANDNAQNQSYTILESRIAETYVAQSSAGLNKSLYDAYIKAFRWSTDRLDPENGGIIAFVSNGAWLDGNSTDGFRKSVGKEFSAIYIFNLRGNARTQGELRRKEAGSVFGSGSRTPISITILVKKPTQTNKKAKIYYHDIGDYLSREEKLKIIRDYKSVGNPKMKWTALHPNEHGDWINQRNDLYDTFFPLEPEKKFEPSERAMFDVIVVAVATGRDAWVNNFSKDKIANNMKRMISFYNTQVDKYIELKQKNKDIRIENVIDTDTSKISWTRGLRQNASNGKKAKYLENALCLTMYRPFLKQNTYFDRFFIESPGVLSRLFPTNNHENLLICCSGYGGNKDFTTLISNRIPDYHFQENGQCFPLYYYEERDDENEKGEYLPFTDDEKEKDKYTRTDAISDFIIERARRMYGNIVKKEDIFYYVYGFLHNPDYRKTFASDLKKSLPRIPLVEEPKDFWHFSKAGRKLAEIHLNYENVPPYKEVKVTNQTSGFYKVEKMRFPEKGRKDTIIFNSKITISNIPEKAYEYVVNGKSAIEWIMERYQITTHKESGIINDPNDWADEVGNPRYILDLLLSIINVSVQTVDIVNDLPKVKFE